MKSAIVFTILTLALQPSAEPIAATCFLIGIGVGIGIGAGIWNKRNVLHHNPSAIGEWKRNHPDRTEDLDALLSIPPSLGENTRNILRPGTSFQTTVLLR
jgi:hypothetical protein